MNTTYFLSSLESYALEAVRSCKFVALKHFDTGKECVLAEVDPPIPGEPFGVATDIQQVVLANRHEGERLSLIDEFPCFVHVARPLSNDIEERDSISVDDVENFAWGELYRSHEDAASHRFDK